MLPSIISSFAPVALSFFLAAVSASVVPRATTCNGSPDLCDRTYGNVTFVGAHDSYAVGLNNLATNQDYNITQQLNDGVRMLQMQAHNSSGTIQLCHTSCSLFNGGTLQNYLTSVKSWMDSNPNDVVSLLIVNSDGFLPSDYDSVFKAAALDTLSYAPPSSSIPAGSWPTLGSLIDSGKRLVTFMDAGADLTSVPYIIDEFTNVWETAFDVTDTTFDCNVNRTKGDPTTQLYLINHFLDKIVLGQPAPDVEDASTTNGVSGVGSLGQQVQTCAAANGRNPNFMLVDFYEYGGGSVFQVAASANGVSYSPSIPIATPLSASGAANPTSSSTSSPNTANGAGSVSASAHVMTLVSISAGLIIGAWGIL
ncbi:PLC-like phosphodiesterase [Artomyces pyxidatus]|uniref:PLC-like phosphodiesterase n=1 Tax=Artomyces pyxidatus TaxID=48021 RepID=A0ACB8TIG2_9AGAM|nr:PLC-like phosphodiesterase [Artomyces pyxidatus]